MDSDSDGYVTLRELSAFLAKARADGANGVSAGQMKAFIRAADKSGDGRLNFMEFMTYCQGHLSL